MSDNSLKEFQKKFDYVINLTIIILEVYSGLRMNRWKEVNCYSYLTSLNLVILMLVKVVYTYIKDYTKYLIKLTMVNMMER
jgi:hypothetical protein